ncbi:MAG: hypothetical protein AB8B82_03015 [Roseovarius sp.]
MTLLIACSVGVAVLAALVLSGGMAALDLAHPFWQTKASITGALVGCVLSAGLIWITEAQRRYARTVAMGVGVLLAGVGFVTWRAARTFIDSAEYEPTAGQIWFFGYHALTALVVLFVAMTVIALRRS